jgi:hypothetical protein
LSDCQPLVGGKFVETGGFVVVHGQAAAAGFVEGAPLVLREGEAQLHCGMEVGCPVIIALQCAVGSCGLTVESDGFLVVFWQSAAAGFVEDTEPGLRKGEALIRSETLKAGSFNIILRQIATARLVERSQIVPRDGVALVRGGPVEPRGFDQGLFAAVPKQMQCPGKLKSQPSVVGPAGHRRLANLDRQWGVDLPRRYAGNVRWTGRVVGACSQAVAGIRARRRRLFV